MPYLDSLEYGYTLIDNLLPDLHKRELPNNFLLPCSYIQCARDICLSGWKTQLFML